MSVHKRIVVECDHRTPEWDQDALGPGPSLRLVRCSATWEGEIAEPRDVAIDRAHRYGWSRDGGYDYCPEHGGDK